MRCFIAIELPDKVKTVLAGIQLRLKKSRSDIRWVKIDNIHLTLKFLGDIEENRVNSIIRAIKGTCEKHNSFSIDITGVGTFPAGKSPRVLWVGINNNKELSHLQEEIDKELNSQGFAREKRSFSPHLTLGRFRSSRGRDLLLDNIDMMKNDSFGQFDVRSVYLIRSDLKPSGAVYSRIAEFPLM